MEWDFNNFLVFIFVCRLFKNLTHLSVKSCTVFTDKALEAIAGTVPVAMNFKCFIIGAYLCESRVGEIAINILHSAYGDCFVCLVFS